MAPKEDLRFDDRNKSSSSSSSLGGDDGDCSGRRDDGCGGSTSRPSAVPGQTRVLETADGAPYVLCSSREAFVNPTTPPHLTPEQVNETLNLTLGLPRTVLTWRSGTSRWLLDLIALLDVVLVSWWEPFLCVVWSRHVPVSLKRGLIFAAWRVYLAFHRAVLGRSTGLHRSASEESHALTTVMFWAQFIPIHPPRIRFSLGELHVVSRSEVPEPSRVVWINDDSFLSGQDVPASQLDHCTVRGMCIRRIFGDSNGGETTDDDDDDDGLPGTKDGRRVLFWIYGGAYLAGDCQSNSAVVDEFIHDCGLDAAFVPQFRLAPEATMDDVLWDVCLAYAWLCRRVDDPATQIVVAGVSSGGALALRLVQLIAERSRGEDVLPSLLAPLLDGGGAAAVPCRQPLAVVMFGPYVDYTEPKIGSFLHFAKHDLVVSEAVQEYGLPYLDGFIPKLEGDDDGDGSNAAGRRAHSPVHRSMEGLPPLCFVVSEHEVTYDMTVQCVNRARAEGVAATIGVWKYMCHTFTFLQAFLPEGRLSMEFAKDWVRQQLDTRP